MLLRLPEIRGAYNAYVAESPESVFSKLDTTQMYQFGRTILYVDFSLDRYKVFQKDKCICAGCGKQGTIMILERQFPHEKNPFHIHRDPHFNLYGIYNDALLLFTIDHIKPKSKGGPDDLENLQTMCWPCNKKKGAKYQETI